MRRLALISAALCAACQPPTAATPEVGQLGAEIVVDRTLHTFIQVFQLVVVRGVTRDNAPVVCQDMPATIDIEDPRIVPLAEPRQIPWDGKTTEAQVEGLSVPANQPLVIVVKGLTRNAQGTFVIGRGCKDNLTFAGGTSNQESIDVRAATGAPCTAPGQCEAGLECYQSPELPGGYCAKVGCMSDADCLPGSRCAADATGSAICARICDSLQDCEPTQSQDCIGRLGPDGSCGRRVCVFPLWSKAKEC